MTTTPIWLFDLGNTRLKCAMLAADGRVGTVVGLAHDGICFDDGALDADLPAHIDAACVASVASPPLRDSLLDALARRGARVSIAETAMHRAGVTIAYPQPQKLGVDRFLALLAAHARAGDSGALVVGVGTALTVDLLGGDGVHRGGRIAPSPQLMREALHARAAHLPAQGGGYVEFADDTGDALVSGCDGAALALVERSLRHATALLGLAPALLLHGGGRAPLLERLDDAIDVPDLVLEGLALWTAGE